MRQLRTVTSLVLLTFAGAAAAAAQTPPDKVFEMPGVFRIALPQGWQRSRVINDRYTVATFSSKNLTLEVLRDVNDTPAEQYAKDVTDFRLEPEWDEYPGRYTPREVLSDPTYYTDYTETIADRSDEHTLIGGVPAQWVRYRVEFKKPPAEVFAARVWTVFLLSPGEYWILQLRGDERAWPATDSDLKRMVQSFELLEPMLTRVKTISLAEAARQASSTLSEGKCPIGGSTFGMSVVVSCDWKLTGQWQGAADKDGRIGVERLERSSPHQSLYIQHHVGNWSADEYSRIQELYVADQSKRAGEYNRTGKRDIVVDGIPGTIITGWCSSSYDFTVTHNRILWQTARRYWGGSHGSRQLLTVSKGTDHFSIMFAAAETADVLDKLPASIHFFALHQQQTAGSSDSGATGSAGKAAPPTKNELERLREDVRLLKDSGSHCRLGKALDASGDHATALNELATAIQLNPRNPEADREIGRVYAAQNDLTRAIAAYQKVLFYSSNSDLDAHEQLARLYAKSGNSLFTLFHVDNAAERADDVMLPEDEIAPGRKALEKYMEQEKALDKSLSEDPVPQKLQDVLRLTELSMKYGDFAFANGNCRIVHLIDRRNPRALACLAQTSEVAGEHDATVGFALDWLVLSPNNPEAHYWLAHGYLLEPADYVNAAESYKAVIRNAGQGQIAPAMLQEARATLPVCYQQLHDWQGAADAYDSAVRESPSDGQILNNASWFFATTEPSFRNPAKALEYGNRAVAIAPSNANVMDTLAEAYFVNGRIDDAVATEQKALALDPEREDLQKQMEKFKQAQQSRKTQQPHNK